MKNKNLMLGIIMGVLVPIGVLASNLTLPYTFTAGTPIRASEVNANFAAVLAAVNSKLDATANLTHSGTRLKSFGLISADGMSAVSGGAQIFFDAQLSTYCSTDFPATDGQLRCLPLAIQNVNFFSQPTCIEASQLFGHQSYYSQPGWPTQTNFYNAVATTQGVEVRTSDLYSGTVYSLNTGGTCVIANPGQQVYQPGSIVPPATFQQITRAVF